MGPTARARLSRRARARSAAEGGFTLVELLVVLFILLIVVTSLASVLVSATHTEVDANKRFQAQEQARTGLDLLRRELHCASAVTQTSGSPLVAGTAYSAITASLPSTCPTNVTQAATFYVTWCTSASTLTTGDFALYRVTSTSTQPTCASPGTVKRADYLTTSTPFCLPSSATACSGVLKPPSSLPLLHVTMPVNVNGPASTVDTYNIVDDIALRNGAHT
ncbi:MAG TPA: prepilin-type N-terminal cleavage/methylation domain-containing protein [Gaiellaceae bacterium]|nr:prepilin-type N-terminal cleavage/methylation domain-containing protein [Gaiellaceae bacterium]